MTVPGDLDVGIDCQLVKSSACYYYYYYYFGFTYCDEVEELEINATLLLLFFYLVIDLRHKFLLL